LMVSPSLSFWNFLVALETGISAGFGGFCGGEGVAGQACSWWLKNLGARKSSQR
jgi:hypothetical protein